jgi:hypothetical protein
VSGHDDAPAHQPLGFRALFLPPTDGAGAGPGWSAKVREFGVTRLNSIAFTHPEERMLFALDCDL